MAHLNIFISGFRPRSGAWAHRHWQDGPNNNGIGGVLVVHNDKADVTPREVQNLSNFCKQFIWPEGKLPVLSGFMKTKPEIHEWATREGFDKFCGKGKAVAIPESGVGQHRGHREEPKEGRAKSQEVRAWTQQVARKAEEDDLEKLGELPDIEGF